MQRQWGQRWSWRRRRWVRIALAVALVACSPFVNDRHPTNTVVTSTTDLPRGHQLVDADLAPIAVDTRLVPDGAVNQVDIAVGRFLDAPLRRGETLTDVRLLDPDDDRTSRRAVPIPLADPALGAILATGDILDLVASGDPHSTSGEPGTGRTIATAVEVIDIPEQRPGGALTIMVSIHAEQAAHVAAVASSAPISVLVHR